MAFTKTRQEARYSLARRCGIAGATGETTSISLTAAVLNEFINDAYQETYGILIKRWADYYTIASTTLAMVAGTASYSLPTDFYKLRKVELKRGSRWHKLLPNDLDVSHRFHDNNTPSRYRLQSRNIIFAPAPAAVENYRIYYIPIRAPLTADSDIITFDVPEEYKLILTIAWRDCLDAQDLDPSPAIAKIADLVPLLRSDADDRDATEAFSLDPYGPKYDWNDDADGGWSY